MGERTIRTCDCCKQEQEPGFAPALRLRSVTLVLSTGSRRPIDGAAVAAVVVRGAELNLSLEVCDRCFGMVAKITEAVETIVASYGPDAQNLPRAVALPPRRRRG